MGGGAFFDPLVHVDRGGYVECPRLSTRGGEGVRFGSKLVYVVVECPLIASHSDYDQLVLVILNSTYF